MMTRALPLDAQASNGQHHTVRRYRNAVFRLEMSDQQRSCPYRRAIAKLTRITSDDAVNEWIDDALGRAGAARARRIGKTKGEVIIVALEETPSPVVDTLTRNTEALRDFFNGAAFVKPEQSVSPHDLASIARSRNDLFQCDALFAVEFDGSHHFPQFENWLRMTSLYSCQRTFSVLLNVSST